MIRAWIGIALLAASWLLGTGYLYGASWPAWGVVVAVGAVLLIGPVQPMPPPPTALVAALMFLAAAWIAPWPYRIAPLMIAAGAAAWHPPTLRRWVQPLASALVVGGLILMAQAISLRAYASATARSHELPEPLPLMIAAVAQWVGIDAGTDGANITMGSMRQPHPLGATWELLLDVPTLCFLVGGVTYLLMLARARLPREQRRSWFLHSASALLLCVIAWLPLRVALLLSMYMHRALRTDYDAPLNLMNQFYTPWVYLALLVGPVLLAVRFVRPPMLQAAALPAPSPAPPLRRRLAAVTASIAAAALLTAGVLWDPPGARKPGRVLVDEFHSNWERTDRPFDTEWYGHLSAYNYAVLYDYCSRFYDMGRLTKAIDEQALRNCDVLIVKVPTARYEPREVAAIRRFVERGGGLMLVGEHTDVWGSSTYLNDIADQFGFSYRTDCLFGLDSTFEERYVPPLTPHPIIGHMGPLDFAVSCSIDPGASLGRAVIWNTGLRSAPADYHASNFYPQILDFPESRYGAFVQLWAIRHGAGRVAAFTDSTIFSNFSFFEPGKSELMLGMIEWLNRRPAMNAAPWLGLIGLFAAVGALFLARQWNGAWLALIGSACLGWAIVAAGVSAAHAAAMPLPQAQRPLTRVIIDRTVSDVTLPTGGFIAGKSDGFGIFERWILRLGYFTQRRAGAGVFDGDMTVIIYPSKPVSPTFRDELVRYVEKGGKVLVLDSPENLSSTANALLQPFGITLGSNIGSGELSLPPGWPKIAVSAAQQVSGGQPLISIASTPVAATARRGSGSITVIGFGSRFADTEMGVTGDVMPDADLKAVYDLEFALLRSLIMNEPLLRTEYRTQ